MSRRKLDDRGDTPRRRHRVSTTLSARERRLFRNVQRYVGGFTGDYSAADALRFLIRNWSGDLSDDELICLLTKKLRARTAQKT